jgi:hypothetical protein
VTDQYYAPLNETLLKYSRWEELRRVVETCLRWRNKKRGIINPVEIWEAEEAIIGLSQSQCYRALLAQLRLDAKVKKDNVLAPLAPFLDKRGLIRLGGRTEASRLNYNAKYPLLLHHKDPITTLLARFIHLQLEHSGGPRAIITELNKRFWAPKATMLFRKIAYGCIPCQKRLAKPTKQIMAPLPFYRMPSARLHPFDHSVIDVGGPFQTKIGRSMVKRWLLVIRCSTTGSVHLEMIDYMDTSSFLLAV